LGPGDERTAWMRGIATGWGLAEQAATGCRAGENVGAASKGPVYRLLSFW